MRPKQPISLGVPPGEPLKAVMAAHRDLVTALARFDPRLVKMAPAGDRAER